MGVDSIIIKFGGTFADGEGHRTTKIVNNVIKKTVLHLLEQRDFDSLCLYARRFNTGMFDTPKIKELEITLEGKEVLVINAVYGYDSDYNAYMVKWF